jgi:hypothetical protein
MIKYSLKCARGHEFEAWFQSSEAYEKLAKRHQLSCNECGSDRVEKALMAPRITTTKTLETPHALAANNEMLAKRAALADLRAKLLAGSEDVGTNFAQEARRMQDDDAPTRAIHGQATLNEVKSLLEDGIPVHPLPPRREDLS